MKKKKTKIDSIDQINKLETILGEKSAIDMIRKRLRQEKREEGVWK